MGLKDRGDCLSRLSNDKTIGFFDNLFLVYSFEDGYSPMYSSKIVANGANKAQRKMCKNFWENVKVD